jgi:hypothetical protein
VSASGFRFRVTGGVSGPLLAAFVLVGCAGPAPSVSDSPTGSLNTSPVPSNESAPRPVQATVLPVPSVAPSARPSLIAASWRATGAMITPHAFHTSTLLVDGRVLVTGGLVNDRLDGQASRSAEQYDATSGTWSAVSRMTTARWGHTATLLANGKVLVAGGHASGTDGLDSAEVYDPSDGSWTTTGRMTSGRGGHAATLLPDGRVLVVGGGAEETLMEGAPRSDTAEVYDPAQGTWTAIRRLTEPRAAFTATLLPDGSVLVAGGNPSFASAERYEPASGRWTPTGSMAEGRSGHTATLLSDGTVLVTGGCACSEPGATASAEVYDGNGASWADAGRMHIGRMFHAASLLQDGRVLVVNEGLAGDSAPSAELYDPGSRRWATTASPLRGRLGYTATSLLNGDVLLAGDYDADGETTSELYERGSPAG